MRGIRCAAAVLAVIAATTLGAVSSGTASADSQVVPGSLSTAGEQTGPITLSVAPGTTPTAVTAVLSSPAVIDGSTTTILVNGRPALTVPSTLYRQVVVPLLPTDVVAGGTISVALRPDPPPGASSCNLVPPLTLRKLALSYVGTETPPASPTDFFPASAARIDVRVARDSSDDVLRAALTAVAALSARYPADTPVVLSASDVPLVTTGAGQRVVTITAADTPPAATVDVAGPVPVLALTGSGDDLAAAAAALGPVTDPSSDPNGDTIPPGPSRTLRELRAAAPGEPEADAVGTETVPVRQDSFGGPVSSYDVHLEGTHSAVPDTAAARLDVYVDDQLVGSAVAGADPSIDLDLVVPGSMLHSSDVLRVTLRSAADTTAACAPGLPLELALDDTTSTVTATPVDPDATDATAATGFQLLPQSFDGRLPVAIRQVGADRIDGAVDAATLVAALQREAARPLQVTLVEPDLLARGTESGVLVGAGAADAAALDAPLPLDGTGLPASGSATSVVSPGAPYAALQSVAVGGHRLLVLGSWAPGDVAAPAGWSHRVADFVTDTGWPELGGDVLVLGSGRPFTVDSGRRPTSPAGPGETATPTPTAGSTAVPEQAAVTRSSYVVWFAVAIGVLLALLVAQTVLRARRARRDAVTQGGDDEEWDDEDDPDVAFSPDADVSDSLSRGRQPLVDLNRGRPPRP